MRKLSTGKLFHYYFYDMKLKNKLSIILFIVVLIPSIVLLLLLNTQFSELLLENTLNSEIALTKQTAANVSNTMSSFRNVSDDILAEDFMTNISEYSDISPFTLLSPGNGYANNITSFCNRIQTTINRGQVNSVKIYLDSTYSAIYENADIASYDIFSSQEKIKGSYWYGIFQSSIYSSLICPELYLTPFESETYGDMAIARKIPIYAKGTTHWVYVVIYFSSSSIDSIIKKDLSLSDSTNYIINERDSLISTSDSNLSGKYILRYENVRKVIPSGTRFETVKLSTGKIYMGYREIVGTKWYLITVIPTESIMLSTRQLVSHFVLIYLIFIALAFFIATALANSVAKRVTSLIIPMQLVKENKPVSIKAPPSKDEIGVLVDTYNYMADRIDSLMAEQSKAELRALQAQTNPHFLYNTLDMINWLSKSGKNTEVTKAIQALSKFYKLTLSKGNTTVTIADELQHVSLYVELQNMRYKNKIDFIIDVPDEILPYEIPKLILQPIIENAIQHGILEKESKQGTIVITGWLETLTVVFLISDDGAGMSREKLETVLTGKGLSRKGSNIGVYNTHQRLQLFYGKEFGLTYRSTLNIGTEVEIRIPSKKAEEVPSLIPSLSIPSDN